MEIYTKFFSAISFILALLGLMDFSDIMKLCSTPNSCCQQNVKCFACAFIILRFVFTKLKSSNVKFKYTLTE